MDKSHAILGIMETYTSSSITFITTTVDFNWDYSLHNGAVLEFALDLFENLDCVDSNGCGGTTLGRPISIHIDTYKRPTKKQREQIYYLQDKLVGMFPQYDWDFSLHYA